MHGVPTVHPAEGQPGELVLPYENHSDVCPGMKSAEDGDGSADIHTRIGESTTCGIGS
ncbi:MAG: hypothetical protein PWP08_1094 [Methanofollis sp.]|nr:hypothetical protein [Methanofollis sp.]